MSRRDKIVLQVILWLAVGTFLFGILAMVGVSKPAPVAEQPERPTVTVAE